MVAEEDSAGLSDDTAAVATRGREEATIDESVARATRLDRGGAIFGFIADDDEARPNVERILKLRRAIIM